MTNEKSISLDHGSGGLASQNLIGDLFLKYLTSPLLRDLEDCAVLGEHDGRIAFTTDSYVVDPLFFPGGDIGKLAVCGTVSVLLSPADWLPHIIGALCVSVPMFLLCLVIDGAFGGGDIKLMAAAGLFLGWQNTLLAMFFGIVFGGMYGIYLLAAKKAGKKDHFAFGPFLCAGIVIAMLFGGPVLEWYCAFL